MNKNTLTAAAFMALGLNHPTLPLTIDTVIDHWDAGFLELVQAVTNYAPYADALATKAAAVMEDYPGVFDYEVFDYEVFDYEVSEKFGSWFAEQVMLYPSGGIEPEPADCIGQLVELTYQFFVRLEPIKAVKLLDALTDVPFTTGE